MPLGRTAPPPFLRGVRIRFKNPKTCVSRVQEPATVARAPVECRAASGASDAESHFSEAIRRGAEKPRTQSQSHQASRGRASSRQPSCLRPGEVEVPHDALHVGPLDFASSFGAPMLP